MFKSIDSILKKISKIVQDLENVKDRLDVEVQVKDSELKTLNDKRSSLVNESMRADKLLTKWKEMV